MSRVGLQPIEIPSGVTVTLDGCHVTVKGPNGTIARELPAACNYNLDGSTLTVVRKADDKTSRSMHGLSRTLVANMVTGVTEGFSKELEIIGVGYKAELQGKELVLNVGYSHPVRVAPPEGVKIETPAATKIKISGANKEHVGQLAADIRKIRPPEPYKGKGIRYVGEFVRRKAGKAAAGA
jgi:large subunit ribosomal protein L6